jgi:hypothetical protein
VRLPAAQQLARDHRRHRRAARAQVADVGGQVGLGAVLEQVAAGAGLEGLDHVGLVAEDRQHHHRAGRLHVAALADHLQAGSVGQAQVDQQHVDRVVDQPGQDVAGVRGAVGQAQRRIRIDHARDALAHAGVVLDQRNLCVRGHACAAATGLHADMREMEARRMAEGFLRSEQQKGSRHKG